MNFWRKRWWEGKITWKKESKCMEPNLYTPFLLSRSYLLSEDTHWIWKEADITLKCIFRNQKQLNFSVLSEHWIYSLPPKRNCWRGKHRWRRISTRTLPNHSAAEDFHTIQCMAVFCGCIFPPLHRSWLRWAVVLFLMAALLRSQRLEEVRMFHSYELSLALSTRQISVGLWSATTEHIKALKGRNNQVSEKDCDVVIRHGREF